MNPNQFRTAFAQRHGFEPPEPLVDLLFFGVDEFEAFAVTGCRPARPEDVAADERRWPAMPPGFYPFGEVGDGDYFGLYYPWRLPDGRLPVAQFFHETGHVTVLASDVRGFIFRQMILGPLRHWPDGYPEDAGERRRGIERARRWAARFRIPDGDQPWNSWSARFYSLNLAGRHEHALRLDPLAPASLLWRAQFEMEGNPHRPETLALLEKLLDAYPELGGAHLLKARWLLLQGRVGEAAAVYLAALRCPHMTLGHISPGGEADPRLPEGSDGEVAGFARSCPCLPSGFSTDPLLVLSVVFDEDFTASPLEVRYLAVARHAQRLREVAERFWQEGRRREAIAQMLNVLFLTSYTEDQGKTAVESLARWYDEAGDAVLAGHARRILEQPA